MDRVLYAKFSNERKDELKIVTRICEDGFGDKYVLKTAMVDKAKIHLDRMEKQYKSLKQKYEGTRFIPNRLWKTRDGCAFEYIVGDSMSKLLDEMLDMDDKAGAYELLQEYVEQVKCAYSERVFEISEEFKMIFGMIDSTKSNAWVASSCINIDLIFDNIIVNENGWNVIDYEWTFDILIPIKFLIYRAIFYYMYMNEKRRRFLGEDIYERFEISKDEISLFEKMESSFQRYVLNQNKSIHIISDLCGNRNESVCLNEYFDDRQKIELLYRLQVYYTNTENLWDEKCSWIEKRNVTKNGEYVVRIPINNYKYLRIDPAQRSCMIRILELVYDGGEQVAFTSNGRQIGDIIVFDSNDPQMIFSNIPEKSKWILFKYVPYLVDEEASAFILSLKSEDDKMIEQLQYAVLDRENRIEEMLASTSWRITKPLRRIKQWFARKKACV